MTVSSHKPKAPSVPSRLHARQIAAAMREAIPRGDVHSTAVTIFPITVLNTCKQPASSVRMFQSMSLYNIPADMSQALLGRIHASLLQHTVQFLQGRHSMPS